MTLYHSFAWPQAVEAFTAIAVADPACGAARWGRAMSLLGNPFVWPAGLTAQNLNDLVAALEAARAAGLKTARERDYVDAVRVFVHDHATTPHVLRMQAFDVAMTQLAARHAEDNEAIILSALITTANFNPTDKTYANQLAAALKLEPLFKAYPDHPGVAHYLIHSYDYPPIAKQGLDAAKAYSGIAPDAAHALHMPSHILTRVGYWKESITANRESARVAGDKAFDGHHASDYMVYTHLQLAQDEAARGAMQRAFSMKPIDNVAAAFAYAAMPARMALERGDWTAAASLPLTPGADVYPWKKYPRSEANNAFALCADGKSAECIDGLRSTAVREEALAQRDDFPCIHARGRPGFDLHRAQRALAGPLRRQRVEPLRDLGKELAFHRRASSSSLSSCLSNRFSRASSSSISSLSYTVNSQNCASVLRKK